MLTIQKNTIFTNVAKYKITFYLFILFLMFCIALFVMFCFFFTSFRTSDGGVFWEGLEKEVTGVDITSWLGDANWTKSSGKPAAHPNSR